MIEGEEEDKAVVSDDDSEQQAAEPTEAEVKAREKGWTPKDEYKGDPERWLPAEDWLERAPRKLIPKLEGKVSELEKTISTHADTVKRLERMQEVAVERARKSVVDEYEAKKEKAVELGDTDAYKAAVKGEKEALKQIDADAAEEEKKAKESGAIPPKVRAEVEAWIADNDWYTKDQKLGRYARTVYNDVEEDMPGASETEKLAEVKERVAEMFPDKFGRKTNGSGSKVEGGSRVSGEGGSGSGAARLPAEVRAIAKKQIEQKLFKDMDDYARDYWKEMEQA